MVLGFILQVCFLVIQIVFDESKVGLSFSMPGKLSLINTLLGRVRGLVCGQIDLRLPTKQLGRNFGQEDVRLQKGLRLRREEILPRRRQSRYH